MTVHKTRDAAIADALATMEDGEVLYIHAEGCRSGDAAGTEDHGEWEVHHGDGEGCTRTPLVITKGAAA